MPMNWSAEADAKLMATIIQKCDVKLNAAQMKEIAAIMGPDCTPKAISHRMTHFRKIAGDTNTKATETNDNGDTKAVKPRKTATGPKKNGRGVTVKEEPTERTPSAGGDDDVGKYMTPPASRTKRAGSKRNYAELAGEGSDVDGEGEEEDDGLDKRVKIEVGEDIGEGLRQGADDPDVFE